MGSVSIAAEIEAANAQFSAAFGDLEGQATETLGNLSDVTGILTSRLKTVATQGFSQLKGAGLDANTALAENERLMLLSADAAAYYDITVEEANARLRSFMRGNTEAGDMIGLFTSETQRNEEAIRKYGQKWLDLTEAQKQLLMLDVAEHIYAQNGAVGQAAREADSWQVATGNLAAAWNQVLGAFGKPIMDVLSPIVTSLTTFLTENQSVATSFGETVGDVIENALSFIQDALQWFSDNQGTVTFALGLIAVGFIAMKWAVNPIGAAIESVIIAIGLLIANWEDVKTAAAALWDSIQTNVVAAWDAVVSAVEGAIAKVKEFFGLESAPTPSYSLGADGTAAIGSGDARPWYVRENAADDPNASGLNYVPYNNYRSLLHVGEAVLTRQQAEEWRRGLSGGGISAEDIAAAVSNALAGTPVVMDGEVVGRLLTDRVSRNIARKTKVTRRYATT